MLLDTFGLVDLYRYVNVEQSVRLKIADLVREKGLVSDGKACHRKPITSLLQPLRDNLVQDNTGTLLLQLV